MGYGAVSKLLHWGMAFLVLFAIGAVEFKGRLPKGVLRHEIMIWHVQAGLCVFILIWIRIAWRLQQAAPLITPPLSRIQSYASRLAHVALYVLMLGLPLLGILARQSKGKPVDFFGHALPILLDEDKGLPYALSIRNAHEYLGNVLIGLVAIHAAAAIFHHVIRQDDTLKRMLPWRSEI